MAADLKQVKKEALLALGATLLAMGVEYGVRQHVVRPPIKLPEAKAAAKIERTPGPRHFSGFQNPEFFIKVPDGELSDEERKKRTATLKKEEFADPQPDEDIELFIDLGGVAFYNAKTGDTISDIRDTLARHPNYEYLKKQKRSLVGFNYTRPGEIQVGEQIQIPIDQKERRISDEEFALHAHNAISEILSNLDYGEEIKKVVDKVGEKELIASIMAIAKQEAGGMPLGQFSFYRMEPKQLNKQGQEVRRKSISIMHVVQEGPGLKARKKLNMTEGQAMHFQKGVELFLGYLVEKRVLEQGGSVATLFAIDENILAFAIFYNGADVESKNPDYIPRLKVFLIDTRELLDEAERLAEIEFGQTKATSS